VVRHNRRNASLNGIPTKLFCHRNMNPNEESDEIESYSLYSGNIRLVEKLWLFSINVLKR
jgi:hypothetical protein